MPFPTLPAETTYSEIERNLIENEPPGIFPENQNSYWGQMRKVFADYMQANAVDLFTAWYNNIDPRTVDANDIAEWEYRTGVPGDRSSLSLATRRAFVSNRLIQGAWTRTLVNQIIETFISAVLIVGTDSTSFGSGGIPFGAGGATLYSGVTGNVKTLYRVYYDYTSRTQYVRILNTLGEDLSGLTRELTRILPAGWTLNIADVANPLYYSEMIADDAPVLRLPLDGNANDLSGYADNGTLVGTPTTATALVSGVANNGGGSGYTLNGSSQYITVPHAAQLNVGDNFSVEMWVKPAAFTGNPRLLTKGGSLFEVYLNTSGEVRLQRVSDAVVVAHSSVVLSTATTYHIVVTKRYDGAHIYINGVDRTLADTNVAFGNNSSQIVIGRLDSGSTNFFNGVVDEIALYNTILSPAEVLAHYNTGINVA